MRYNNNYTLDILAENPTHPIIYFWGPHQQGGIISESCLSQWYESSFVVEKILYHSAEQYMMAEKARIFGDLSTLKKIMSAETPRECLKLGRSVRNFDQKNWDAQKYNIVRNGNYHKFSQNRNLGNYLLSTKNSILVEASPYDVIWGIGLSKKDALIKSPVEWRGQNLLGYALMETRDALKNTRDN